MIRTALIHILAIATLSAADITVTGTVVSSEDGSPVAGAVVYAPQTSIGTVTDGNGIFSLTVDPSKVPALRVTAVGFSATSVPLDRMRESDVVIRLVPSPVQTNTVVVTANKREQSLADVPVSMSILDSQTMSVRNTVSVDDALRNVSGISFQQSQINIRASSGYSRGVGSRVALLIDGVPLLSGDTGEITFESLPVYQIERIEVVKGAGSALYGSGAMGGVVNIITKGIPERPYFWWKMYGGLYSSPTFPEWTWSDKTRFLNGQYVGFSDRSGSLGYAVSLRRISDDGYRENDWLRRYGGYAKVTYDITPYASLSGTTNIFQQYRGDFLWWKDLKHALQPADAQRNISVSSLRWNSSLEYRQVVNEKIFFDVKAVHFRGNWYRDSLANTQLDRSLSDAFVTDAQLTVTHDAFNTSMFGIVWNAERVRSNIFGQHDGAGGAIYANHEMEFDGGISVSAGARYDRQAVAGLRTEEQINPKAGIRYRIDDGTTLRASAGRGFRAPSVGEYYTSTENTGSAAIVVPNPSLKPEHSWSMEAGMFHSFGDHLSVDAAVFQNDFSDLIEPGVDLDSSVSQTAAVIRFRNITEARIRGFEATVMIDLFQRHVNANVHYNYNWAVDRTTGQFLRARPRHIAGANIGISFHRTQWGADLRYLSRIEEIDENLVRLAPIKNGDERVPTYLLDVHCLVDMHDTGLPLTMGLAVKNVFGYNYTELIGNMEPPRCIMVSLEGTLE